MAGRIPHEETASKRVDEDAEILSRIKSGNRTAFAELVRKYESKVRGMCCRILLDQALADDAAQEVFIKIHKSLVGNFQANSNRAEFRNESLFSTWLYRVTLNQCRDFLRKRKQTKTSSLDQLVEEKGGSVELQYSAEAGNSSDSIDAKKVLEKVLASLSDQYREVIVLREIRELSYQEIALSLGCSVDSVKARLKRARRYLNENLRHLLTSSSVNTEPTPDILWRSKQGD